MTVNPVPTARRRMVGVAVGVESVEEARAVLDAGSHGADVVEIRLDYFREPVDVSELIQASPIPAIVTNRPPREGGHSPLADADRVNTLFEAANAGAAFVDLEWDVATPVAIAQIQATGTRVIVSRHSFDGMPADLGRWASELEQTRADVVKVVGMATDVLQIRPVLEVLRAATVPTIAIAMGEAGKASRVLALRENSCLLTFAAPTGSAGTAPGQISIADMRCVYHADSLGPTTAVYGVVGCRVERTLLASLNTSIVAAGRNAVAVPFPTTGPIGPVLDAFRGLPVDGWLLASPVGVDDLRPFVDRFDPEVYRTQTVSSVVREGSDLVGKHPVGSLEDIVRDWIGRSTTLDTYSDRSIADKKIGSVGRSEWYNRTSQREKGEEV